MFDVFKKKLGSKLATLTPIDNTNNYLVGLSTGQILMAYPCENHGYHFQEL